MTSSVMVFHTGGNKSLVVIVEGLVQGDSTSELSWQEVHRVNLDRGGCSPHIYIHDTQRIRIEETGEFKS